MGFTSSDLWESAKDVKNSISDPSTWGQNEIIDTASYGQEFYLAVKKPSGEVFIALYLIKGIRGEFGTEWGYKDLDSSMVPYYYNCPERLLKLSTVTDENSLKWIEQCREYRARKNKVKKFIASLKDGDMVEIDGIRYKFKFLYKTQPCMTVDDGPLFRYPLRVQMGWKDYKKV